MFDIQCKGEPHEVACEQCGIDLTERTISQAVLCERFDVECANPCGLASQVVEGQSLGLCQNRIEPDEWHSLVRQ